MTGCSPWERDAKVAVSAPGWSRFESVDVWWELTFFREIWVSLVEVSKGRVEAWGLTKIEDREICDSERGTPSDDHNKENEKKNNQTSLKYDLRTRKQTIKTHHSSKLRSRERGLSKSKNRRCSARLGSIEALNHLNLNQRSKYRLNSVDLRDA